METDPFPLEALAATIEAEASATGLPISVERGTADGFGITNAATLNVSIVHGSLPVRVWDEGGGDMWFELPDGLTAAWWRQGRKEASLAEVVIALAEGRYSVDSGVVSVAPRGRKTFMLRTHM